MINNDRISMGMADVKIKEIIYNLKNGRSIIVNDPKGEVENLKKKSN